MGTEGEAVDRSRERPTDTGEKRQATTGGRRPEIGRQSDQMGEDGRGYFARRGTAGQKKGGGGHGAACRAHETILSSIQ